MTVEIGGGRYCIVLYREHRESSYVGLWTYGRMDVWMYVSVYLGTCKIYSRPRGHGREDGMDVRSLIVVVWTWST
jgi:hypothetical protein